MSLQRARHTDDYTDPPRMAPRRKIRKPFVLEYRYIRRMATLFPRHVEWRAHSRYATKASRAQALEALRDKETRRGGETWYEYRVREDH